MPGGPPRTPWCSEGLAPVKGDEVLERIPSLEPPPEEVRDPRLPEEEALEQMELVRFRRGTFWASDRRTRPPEDYRAKRRLRIIRTRLSLWLIYGLGWYHNRQIGG